jgi:hypothetical protein
MGWERSGQREKATKEEEAYVHRSTVSAEDEWSGNLGGMSWRNERGKTTNEARTRT